MSSASQGLKVKVVDNLRCKMFDKATVMFTSALLRSSLIDPLIRIPNYPSGFHRLAFSVGSLFLGWLLRSFSFPSLLE